MKITSISICQAGTCAKDCAGYVKYNFSSRLKHTLTVSVPSVDGEIECLCVLGANILWEASGSLEHLLRLPLVGLHGDFLCYHFAKHSAS